MNADFEKIYSEVVKEEGTFKEAGYRLFLAGMSKGMERQREVDAQIVERMICPEGVRSKVASAIRQGRTEGIYEIRFDG